MLQSPAFAHISVSRSLAIRLLGVALILGTVIGGAASLFAGTAAPAVPAPAAAAPAVHYAAPAPMRQLYPPGVMAAAPKPVVEEALAPSVIVAHPVVLRYGPARGGWVFQITADQLRSASVPRAGGGLSLDRAKVLVYLKPIAAALHAPAQDASLTLSDGKAVLAAEQPGLDLDTNATADLVVRAAANASNRVVDLALKPVAPQVKAATLRPVYTQLQALLNRGFVLHYNGDTYNLKPATLARFLTLTPASAPNPPFTISIDHDKLVDTLDLVAGQVNVAARDPLYRLVNGQVQTVVQPRDGRKLDYEATAAAMIAAFQADQNAADMVVAVSAPNVTAADAANVETPDLLARATTSFSGSSSGRAHNVRFGATLVDGDLIPPDAIFSMNDALGPLTLARGFQMGFGIAHDENGDLTTIPSEAGGICQVATTFFQSAYWAGLTIVERHNHSYWIPRYGQSATGRQGLDATISPPYSDLRVKNTTGHWIRVHAYSNGETMLFELYGVNPHWTVSVSKPTVTKIVPTDDRVTTETSDLMPLGAKVLAEHKQDGFNASITRKVYDASGNMLDNLTLYSHYEPAYDQYVVGTGKNVPKP